MSSLTAAGSMEGYSVSGEEFDTRLSLEIGGGGGSRPPPRRQTVQLFGEVLSLQDHHGHHREEPTAPPRRKKRDSGVAVAAGRQNKKARVFQGSEDGDRRSPSDGGGGGRKKLRLTSVQATLLEDSFRAHNILSHAEKQELARRVGLSARQVEVWFQNRRARSKLKQTEVDCELLRRWCDRLTDENARLRQDLAELRASPAAGVVCPSCCNKRQLAIVAAAGAAEMA